MLKAVIFDMDGVIIDTEPLHQKAFYMMFNTFNLKISKELYQSFTGQSTISVCKNICTLFNLKIPPYELMKIKQDNFKGLFQNDRGLALIPGVLELIKNYHQNGLKLVLASSASMQTINSVFTRFDLDQYFIGKLSGADLKASKPHPEIFEKAALTSGYSKTECIVIEDSTNGIKAANAAGIYCVAFKSPNTLNQSYDTADKVISDFKEINYSKIQALIIV